MDIMEAIRSRHSVRRYNNEAPLTPDQAQALESRIYEINRASGLSIQLVRNEPRAFSGLLAYGSFSGVTNYLVMAGPRSAESRRKVGYHGEELVLLAQTLGLNSCWAGLSYSKIKGTYTLGADEKIYCYIALGRGLTQGVQHRSKAPTQVSNVSADTPAWFNRGVEAALLAPTAVNQQKFHFEYLGLSPREGSAGRVKASTRFSLVGYTDIDLGIAMLHFEAGAACQFDWED